MRGILVLRLLHRLRVDLVMSLVMGVGVGVWVHAG
jgi:hypothetical protein